MIMPGSAERTGGSSIGDTEEVISGTDPNDPDDPRTATRQIEAAITAPT